MSFVPFDMISYIISSDPGRHAIALGRPTCLTVTAGQLVPNRARSKGLERVPADLNGQPHLSTELGISEFGQYAATTPFEFASRGSWVRVPSSPPISTPMGAHTSGRTGGPPSPGSVDIGAVVDAHDIDRSFDFIQLVHDPVGATTSRPEPGQFPLERMANLVWRLDQWSQHELNGCRGDFRRQPSKGALSRSSER